MSTTAKVTGSEQVNENTDKVNKLKGRISELVDELHELRQAVTELQDRHVDLARKLLKPR
jgi:predicted  nucleic acid-binding Zn-ribbon protein